MSLLSINLSIYLSIYVALHLLIVFLLPGEDGSGRRLGGDLQGGDLRGDGRQEEEKEG